MTLPLLDNEPNAELGREPVEVKARQERYLRRELARIDDYFEDCERELRREDREHREKSVGRDQQHIEPTHAEHLRYLLDQIDAMRGIPYLVTLLVIAEPPAFCTIAQWDAGRADKRAGALSPQRAKRWSFATEV